MSPKAIKRIVEKLGEEPLLWLITNFANERLPGNKHLARCKKEKFIAAFMEGQFSRLSIADMAKTFSVSTRTLREWIKQAYARMESK